MNSKPFARLIGVLAVFALVATALFWPAWQKLIQSWTLDGSSYGHGPLVVVVCFWLATQAWPKIMHPSRANQGWRLWLLTLAGLGVNCLLILSFAGSIEIATWCLLPLALYALAYCICPRQPTWHLFIPFGFLYFALPVWELTVPLLQPLAVMAVSLTVDLFNIPAYIQGFRVRIPSGEFVVEGGCSGTRYLLVTCALTSLWSYLEFTRLKQTLQLILIGILVSILGNWIRIFSVVLIGHATQMQSSLVHDHEFFGWILFALTLIPVFWFATRLARNSASLQTQTKQQAMLVATSKIQLRQMIALGFTVAPLVLFQFMQLQTKPREAPRLSHNSTQNLQLLADARVFNSWQPDFKGINQWDSWTFQQEDVQYELLMGHISEQNAAQELIAANQSLLPATDSASWQTKLMSTPFNGVTIQHFYGKQWAIRAEYRLGGRWTGPGIAGKWIQIQQFFMAHRLDAQLVLIGTRCGNTCDLAIQSLHNFSLDGLLE